MNPKQILAILWSRRGTALAVFAGVFLAALIVTLFLKPQYTATAQIYINMADPNGATNQIVPGSVARNYVVTQMEAIRSRGTARKVVEIERLASDPVWQQQYKASGENKVDIADWIAGNLQRGLEVTRQTTSDIISVNYRSGSAETAARFANAFAEGYLRQDVERRSNPAQDLVQWFEERLKTLRDRYAETEKQRSALRLEAIRRGDSDANGVQDGPTSLVSALQTARNDVIQARAALERAQSGQNPPSDNAELLLLRKQQSDIDLALKRELPLLGPTHRRIQNLQSNAEQIQTQIESVVQRLRAEMVADKKRELAAAERRVDEINATLSSDEGQRFEQSKSRATAAALDRELESLRSQIDALVQRREKAGVEGAATVGNLSVLSRAATPTGPSWPRIPLVLGVAAGLGLAFGLMLAFLREMLDRRVRCVDDLTGHFNVPVLGVIDGTALTGSLTALPAPPVHMLNGPRRNATLLIEAVNPA